jgi:double-stranded uracil-DNA glycosylase
LSSAPKPPPLGGGDKPLTPAVDATCKTRAIVRRDRDEAVPSAVPDVLAPGLRAVFCGINPGRRSAAAGHHFANPRNDFWRLLHDAGLTPRQLAPGDQRELPSYGFGLTNAAYRTTTGSGDLRRGDFLGARERLNRIAAELRPGVIAFVGKEAYRGTFGERPELGLQSGRLNDALLFVLPSTSPANAAVPYAERLRWFEALAALLRERPSRANGS